MSRALRLTAEAADDLTDIQQWQGQPGSGLAASRRVCTIVAAIKRLRDTPCLHPHGEHRGTRQMVIEGHVVIYGVTPDTGQSATAGDVLVLRVFGPGQSRDRL